MRAAAEGKFASNHNFISLGSRAEATTLPDHSVDFAMAGQAFHWFDPSETKTELLRILKAGSQVALIWNRRDLESPFQLAYENLLERFGTDFLHVDQQRTITDEKIAAFFAPQSYKKASLPNQQRLDAAGLRGRLLSSSYVPTEGDPGYEPMLRAADRLFMQFQTDGFIQFDYLTTVYHGPNHLVQTSPCCFEAPKGASAIIFLSSNNERK